MRTINADALMNDVTERYCKECDKRKGIKNGKQRTVYKIGDAPCRACSVDDMKDELENAPTIDAVPVVRCRDCTHWNSVTKESDFGLCDAWVTLFICTGSDEYCKRGKKKEA